MDPIANMIVSIKNAGDAGRDRVEISYSKIKESILNVIKKEGFIKDVSVKTRNDRKFLNVSLILENRIPKVKGVARVSKTSSRVYKKMSEIRLVRNGYGSVILSTPKGILSGRDARKEGVGGEVLFTIW